MQQKNEPSAEYCYGCCFLGHNATGREICLAVWRCVGFPINE